MSITIEMQAEDRENTGKGVARELRRNGRIPAIIYGGKTDERKISVNLREFEKSYNAGNFRSKVVELKVGNDVERVVPRDIQVHPVTDVPEHSDFLRVDDTTKINVWIPVHFTNEEKATGLKRGGVLNVIRRQIELYCRAANIPEYLEADLTDMQIGESLHISKIKLPEDAELAIKDRDFTVAAIAGRTAKTVEEEEEEEAAAAAAEAEAEAEGGEEAEGSEE